jgi:hypothetical protein
MSNENADRPAVSIEAFRALITRWRAADEEQSGDYYGTDAWRSCADDLEELLGIAEHEPAIRYWWDSPRAD